MLFPHKRHLCLSLTRSPSLVFLLLLQSTLGIFRVLEDALALSVTLKRRDVMPSLLYVMERGLMFSDVTTEFGVCVSWACLGFTTGRLFFKQIILVVY